MGESFVLLIKWLYFIFIYVCLYTYSCQKGHSTHWDWSYKHL